MSNKLKINTIYKLDCFEFISRLEYESVDLAVIDPPYNLKKDKWDTFKSHDDFLKFTYQWIESFLPKLKKGGSLYIFNTPFNSAYILKFLIEKKMIFQNWITWDKRDGMSASKKRYNNSQETILFFTKGKNHTFNYNEIRIPYDSTERIKHAQKKGILKNGKRWFPHPEGKLCNEVWHISSERHKRKKLGKTVSLGHATPKPIDMIERIIKASSNPNDLVVDFFVGSGTTAVAAKKLGRNYICGDKYKKYVDLTVKNLKNKI